MMFPMNLRLVKPYSAILFCDNIWQDKYEMKHKYEIAREKIPIFCWSYFKRRGGMMLKRLFVSGYKAHELGIFNEKNPGLAIIKKAL